MRTQSENDIVAWKERVDRPYKFNEGRDFVRWIPGPSLSTVAQVRDFMLKSGLSYMSAERRKGPCQRTIQDGSFDRVIYVSQNTALLALLFHSSVRSTFVQCYGPLPLVLLPIRILRVESFSWKGLADSEIIISNGQGGPCLGGSHVHLYLIHCSRYKGERILTFVFSITNTKFIQTDFTHPVLYVALYDTGDAPSEPDDYHWAFIVGPSQEEANSKGTLYSMEPRQIMVYNHYRGRKAGQWRWIYHQPTVPLRGQRNLLARLMIAEVNDMSMLQMTVMRYGQVVIMREHLEWMSVKWVKNVLKGLDGETGCLGRRMESFEDVEVEVCTFRSKHLLLDGAIGVTRIFSRRTYYLSFPLFNL